jgi:uncharacterized membrane protein YcaP (DUF421 family)
VDIVFRALAVYGGLMVILRIAGKRTLAQMTTFDFVLLLIIAEATQQGLLGDDFSITNGILVIVTLIGVDIAMSLLKRRFALFSRLSEGRPVIILEDGKPIEERMKRSRIDESDILSFARQTQGIERLEDIKFAVLEQDGGISVIPYRSGG